MAVAALSLVFFVFFPPRRGLPPSSLSHLLFVATSLASARSLPPARSWHTDGIENTPFWWINLYILEPFPVLVSILWRPLLLLSWVCLQPSGVISLLAVLNSLIICVLHKKRTLPQRHTTAFLAWWGLALRLWCVQAVVSCLHCSLLPAELLHFSLEVRWDARLPPVPVKLELWGCVLGTRGACVCSGGLMLYLIYFGLKKTTL